MFQLISKGDYKHLRALGERLYHGCQDSISALLCFDHFFSMPFNLQELSTSGLATVLASFLLYTKGLTSIAFHRTASSDPRFQRLFGFQQASANMFLVFRGSLLATEILKNSRILVTKDEAGIVVRGVDLDWMLNNWMRSHLVLRIKNHSARAFSPCIPYTMIGDCYRGSDCRHAHLAATSLTSDWFHCRIRIIFQQILVYQNVSGLMKFEDRIREQK